MKLRQYAERPVAALRGLRTLVVEWIERICGEALSRAATTPRPANEVRRGDQPELTGEALLQARKDDVRRRMSLEPGSQDT